MVERFIPAINPDDFLVKSKPKRKIKPKTFDNFVSANIVTNAVKNNMKALDTIPYKTDPHKNSFFVKSILHWDQLEDNIVCADAVESFKAALQHRQ